MPVAVLGIGLSQSIMSPQYCSFIPSLLVEKGSSRGEDLSTIVSAVSKIEGCSRRCVTLAAKLSRELDTANMLSACEEVCEPHELHYSRVHVYNKFCHVSVEG